MLPEGGKKTQGGEGAYLLGTGMLSSTAPPLSTRAGGFPWVEALEGLRESCSEGREGRACSGGAGWPERGAWGGAWLAPITQDHQIQCSAAAAVRF